MASFVDKLKSVISKKNSQKTALNYNKAIYNYLGESIVWNNENDDAYISQGYQKNSTVYSLINLITKAATTIPFQVYEIKDKNNYKRFKALTSGTIDSTTPLYLWIRAR